MSIITRKNRSAIRVFGEDAQKLLNDVLTAEITADDSVRWWALLSPQGKIQAEGLIGWAEDAFWLDIPAEIADNFLKRMRLYKLRAKAEIEDLRDSHAVGWSASAPTDGIVHRDPRQAEMGFRIIAPQNTADSWEGSETPYTALRISHGLAELGEDFAPDTLFPHDIGMDLLSGVAFEKGCYVGQEVVSRMQHRGTARRRPVIVSGVKSSAGATLSSGGKDAGPIGQIADGKAIGIVRLDRIAGPEKVEIEGAPVTLALPAWASYRFEDSSSVSDR